MLPGAKLVAGAAAVGGAVFGMVKMSGKIGGKGRNLALGLRADLDNFANAHNFDTYRKFSDGFQEEKIYAEIANPDNLLHFNVTGFTKSQFARFNPAEPVTLGKITSWEMHTIVNNPEFLSRTTFYSKALDGSYEILKDYSPYFGK